MLLAAVPYQNALWTIIHFALPFEKQCYILKAWM